MERSDTRKLSCKMLVADGKATSQALHGRPMARPTITRDGPPPGSQCPASLCSCLLTLPTPFLIKLPLMFLRTRVRVWMFIQDTIQVSQDDEDCKIVPTEYSITCYHSRWGCRLQRGQMLPRSTWGPTPRLGVKPEE
jgi:hypothetical protein